MVRVRYDGYGYEWGLSWSGMGMGMGKGMCGWVQLGYNVWCMDMGTGLFRVQDTLPIYPALPWIWRRTAVPQLQIAALAGREGRNSGRPKALLKSLNRETKPQLC